MSSEGSGNGGKTHLDLYRTMVTIREFETLASKLMKKGKLPGFIHLSIGQEAVAVGVCSVLRQDDYLSSTHRGHGHCIAKGGDVGRMMAELFGRHDGYCKGRVGSMHIADSDLGILGANAIVAGGIPMAVGAAYSALVRGSDQVAVAFFGEGAVAEGTCHESINLAAVWGLPVIFVCENNLYAEHTHISAHLKAEEVRRFAEPYGIQGVSVDGNDVLAVQEAAAQAVARARSGEGPTLLECKTYRWHGHFEGDPQDYRTEEELEEWKTRDPLKALRSRLLEEGDAKEEELESLEEEITRMVQEAAEAAESSDPPEVTALLEDVYQAPLIRDQRSKA